MRWLVLAPYGGLVALAWASGGARFGLVVLACAAFLTMCLRLTTVGEVFRRWGRWLSVNDHDALASLSAAVRAGRRLVRWSSVQPDWYRAAAPQTPDRADDVLAPVVRAGADPAPRASGQVPDILDSTDKRRR
jgi:hypothetical protein